MATSSVATVSTTTTSGKEFPGDSCSLRRLWFFRTFALLVFFSTQPLFIGAATIGCSHKIFTQRGSYCYSYFATGREFQQANRICRDYNNGYLASITSEEENKFILRLATNQTGGDVRFWIGLSDKAVEGVFAWEDTTDITFQKWANQEPGASNQQFRDCVEMRTSGEWYVNERGCQTGPGLPYVCKSLACTTADCVTYQAVTASSSTDSGVIVAIVLSLFITAVIFIGLLYTWKYHNDKWQLYVCYFCKMKESRENINSLQQENLRLRRQLSQQRHGSQLSLNGTGEVIQGPSDGTGGFLPALRPMGASNQVSPAPLGRTSPPPDQTDGRSPPPLRRQTTSGTSINTPLGRGGGSVMGIYQRAGSIQSTANGYGAPTSPVQMRSPRRVSSLVTVNNRDGQGRNSIPTSPRMPYQQLPMFQATTSIQPPNRAAAQATLQPQPTNPRKKPSVIQEAGEEEAGGERSGSSASMPGETEA